jgi:hypothetical protein
MMPFCPSCRYEYTAGVTVCPDCDEPLVDRLPEEEFDTAADREREWKLLYYATSRAAAEFLKETLLASGIDTVVKYRGRFFGRGVSFGLGSVTDAADAEVWVNQAQFAAAEEIRRQTVGDENSHHGFLPENK